MGFFSNLGNKIASTASYLGQKVIDGANTIGSKVLPVVNTIASGVGKVAPFIADAADMVLPGEAGSIIRTIGKGANWIADKTSTGGAAQNTLEKIKSVAQDVNTTANNYANRNN